MKMPDSRAWSALQTRVAHPLLIEIAVRTTARLRTGVMIEFLESRTLLSIVPTATPDFVLYHKSGSAAPDASTSVVGMTAANMRKAYGIDSVKFGSTVGDGSNQTIAIIDAYDAPDITSDLHAFDVAMGLSDPSLTVVKQTGTTTDPSGPGDSWALETSLDVEWAHAVAPAASIVLFEAKSASYADLFAAVDSARNYVGVSAVSMSWGGGETSTIASTYNSHFATPTGHTPITFFASTGDAGAYDNGGSTKAVGYPAVSANVVAVGGTYLSIDASGNYVSESGWGNGTSSGSLGGSGGGISKYSAKPSWQAGVTQSATFRTTPDVAFDADPNSGAAVYDSYDSPSAPWIQVGGTSLASPMWAGVMAIVDQGRVLSGQATLDGPSQTLPMLYSLSSNDFHDVTTGNNGFAAGVGYDLVTGRGTPIVNKLALDLSGYTGPVTPTPSISSFTVSPTSVVTGTSATLSATASEIGGSIAGVSFYRETNGVAGYQAGSDALVAAGSVSGSTYTATATTTGFAANTYTYYAVATDATSQTVTATATLTVTPVPVPAPLIGSFTLSPTSVVTGTATTLTAANVTDAGSTISAVKFYRDSDGVAGLNTSTDTLVGTGTKSGTTWTISAATTGLAAGTYTFYAVATDAAAVSSAPSKATLTVTAAPVVPANDNFAKAQVLTGSTLTVTGSNVNATKETGEPSHAGNAGGKSIWYSWTAPAAGKTTITTAGSSFDTILAVYTGTSVSKLTKVASNDDASGSVLTSSLSFTAVKGTIYRIAVDGYKYSGGTAASGSVVLNLTGPAAAVKKSAVIAESEVTPIIPVSNATSSAFSDVPLTGDSVSAPIDSLHSSPVRAGIVTQAFSSSPIFSSRLRSWMLPADSRHASDASIDINCLPAFDWDVI